MKRVVAFTLIPSPYQVELFDELARRACIDLTVVYVHRSDSRRPWSPRQRQHRSHWLDELTETAARALCDASDVCVFCWYRHSMMRSLMRHVANTGAAWSYWGEALGFRYPRLGRLARFMMLRALHRSGAPIWGIGRWAVERYRAEFGTDRVYVDLPYFSDLQRFLAIRRQGPPRPVVLYSGSLIRRKGVDVLACAWARVAKSRPQAELHVLGDGVERARMERLMAECRDTVRFHGAVDWDELPKYYAKASFLCAPSRYDGWGLIVPEAFAAGIPVIASTQMGASQEMVVPGRNGWVAPPEDVEALQRALEQALSVPEDLYELMSRDARRTAAEFDVRRGAERFEEAVERCTPRRP